MLQENLKQHYYLQKCPYQINAFSLNTDFKILLTENILTIVFVHYCANLQLLTKHKSVDDPALKYSQITRPQFSWPTEH